MGYDVAGNDVTFPVFSQLTRSSVFYRPFRPLGGAASDWWRLAAEQRPRFVGDYFLGGLPNLGASATFAVPVSGDGNTATGQQAGHAPSTGLDIRLAPPTCKITWSECLSFWQLIRQSWKYWILPISFK